MSAADQHDEQYRPRHRHREPSVAPIVVTIVALCGAIILMVAILLIALASR